MCNSVAFGIFKVALKYPQSCNYEHHQFKILHHTQKTLHSLRVNLIPPSPIPRQTASFLLSVCLSILSILCQWNLILCGPHS